jgi:hypothetical protein
MKPWVEMADNNAPVAGATPRWLAAMSQVAEDDGYLSAIGKKHWAFFAEDKPKLLVTFEYAHRIADREGNLPEHYAFAKAQGWSQLCLIAEGDTWWRDPSVFGYFDRLADEAFLEDFDRVLFYGAGAAGYAAAAFSAAAPGAELVLVAPRATADPSVAGWDLRHRRARRLCFTDRYGFAPDMTEGASKVWLVHDPHNRPDAMHAALFRRPWVTDLLARQTGEHTEETLNEMRILERLLLAAMDGKLSANVYANLWRARRSNASYLKALLYAAHRSGRAELEYLICKNVTARINAPRFARRLAELTGG